MANNPLSVPSGFGGIVRFNEEYESRFKLTPAHVVFFALIVVTFVLAMKLFFPVGA